MKGYPQAVREAKWTWEHRATLDRQGRVDAVISLAEWGVFSNRQLGKITGLRPQHVAAFTGKTDHTGGRLSPESLEPILKLIEQDTEGVIDNRATRRAHDSGASIRMIAKLTGRDQSTVTRQIRRAA